MLTFVFSVSAAASALGFGLVVLVLGLMPLSFLKIPEIAYVSAANYIDQQQ